MDSGNYSIDIVSTQWGMDQMLQFSPWLAVDKSPQYEYSLYMVTETNLPLGVTHPGFCIVCTVKTNILCPKLLCPMCCECNVCTCQFSDQTNKDHHQFLWCTCCDGQTQEPMCKLCGDCKQCCNSCEKSTTEDDSDGSPEDDSDSNLDHPTKPTDASHRSFAMRMNTTQSAREQRSSARNQRADNRQNESNTRQGTSISTPRYSPVLLRDMHNNLDFIERNIDDAAEAYLYSAPRIIRQHA